MVFMEIVSIILGRKIVAVKMVLLSKLIFIFINMILDIVEKILCKIKGILNKFIWGGEKPRISFKTVESKFDKGGLAVPNVKKYYRAAMVAAGLDWWRFP